MGEGSGQVESVDSTVWQPSSFPASRIDQRGGSDQLWIRILTLRRSTGVTSKLFELLENESLAVLHSDKCFTEERVLHSIQVKVVKPSKLHIDDLKFKLHSWADNTAE